MCIREDKKNEMGKWKGDIEQEIKEKEGKRNEERHMTWFSSFQPSLTSINPHVHPPSQILVFVDIFVLWLSSVIFLMVGL